MNCIKNKKREINVGNARANRQWIINKNIYRYICDSYLTTHRVYVQKKKKNNK